MSGTYLHSAPLLESPQNTRRGKSPDRVLGIPATAIMEEEERGPIFDGVRYTIIPSDDLSGDKTRLVGSHMRL
jgi:hypothetical protein